MYKQLTLLIINHGFNLIISPFNIFQARFKEFGEVGLSTTRKVYKVFTEVGQSPWLREALPWPRQCNKLHSTICIVLLSEFVSQNMWLQHCDPMDYTVCEILEARILEWIACPFSRASSQPRD